VLLAAVGTKNNGDVGGDEKLIINFMWPCNKIPESFTKANSIASIILTSA